MFLLFFLFLSSFFFFFVFSHLSIMSLNYLIGKGEIFFLCVFIFVFKLVDFADNSEQCRVKDRDCVTSIAPILLLPQLEHHEEFFLICFTSRKIFQMALK